MLQCYFDDSGTHDASDFVVWGGVLGGIEHLKIWTSNGAIFFSSHCRESHAIKNFHLSNCVAGEGDFESYKPAERDRVRYLFREAILESRLMPVAFGIDVLAWDQHFQGDMRDQLGEAERASYGLCVKAAFDVAESHREKMAVFMDGGRQSDGLRMMCGGAQDLIPEGAKLSTIAFPAVERTPGLQAADTVAHEFYRYGLARLSDNDVEPTAHFRSFLDQLEQSHWAIMGANQIKVLAQKMRVELGL